MILSFAYSTFLLYILQIFTQKEMYNMADTTDLPTFNPYAYVQEIGELTRKYLSEHERWVVHAILNDAALRELISEESVAKLKEDKKLEALNTGELHAVQAQLETYPGLRALAAHEEAHNIYLNDKKDPKARILSEAAHTLTGIEIHPGTQIGDNFFIDHGTGCIIGEKAQIGKNALIYHNVTLGAYGNANPATRHPIIGDDVIISTGTKVLGYVQIGNKVKIGSNVLLAGNTLKVHDGAIIRDGVQVGDNNEIMPEVQIGDGAKIARGIGKITENIPAYAQVVGRDTQGNLQFANMVNVESQAPASIEDSLTETPKTKVMTTEYLGSVVQRINQQMASLASRVSNYFTPNPPAIPQASSVGR